MLGVDFKVARAEGLKDEAKGAVVADEVVLGGEEGGDGEGGVDEVELAAGADFGLAAELGTPGGDVVDEVEIGEGIDVGPDGGGATDGRGVAGGIFSIAEDGLVVDRLGNVAGETADDGAHSGGVVEFLVELGDVVVDDGV